MKKKILSLALVVVLSLGLVPTSGLAAGQTFSDVPENHWAYTDVEAAAAAGLMNGTGNGAFSPNLKVTVAQFLTLLGRLVFPDTKVGENDTWYGPYVTKAQEAGLLAGTQVNVNDVEAEISRYDMAVILRAAAKRLGVKEKSAQSSEVTDYLDISTRYADAVLAVYGMGLIKGDQNGNFNGSSTMTRAEVATVIMRLAKTPEVKTWVETWDVYEMPRTGEYVTVKVSGRINADVIGARVGLYYKDGRLLGETKTDGTTDSENRTLWSMEVTMDKADYSETDKLYYAALIGQAKERVFGNMLETPEEYCIPQSLQELSSNGFLVRVKVVTPEQPVEPQMMQMKGWLQYGSKGDPEKNGIGVNEVPFQLRYTEDNGVTYQVIATEVTQDKANGKDDPGYFQLTTYLDKTTFAKFWIGEGQLYISAEATVNGQKYVTQDRRTDGKATIVPIGHDWGYLFVDLVPPNGGEMMDIPVSGIVTAMTYVGPADRTGEIRYYGSGEGHERLLTNSTVRIYFDPQQEGVSRVLIAETTADGGYIQGTVSIDSAYYRTKGAYYVVEIEAFLDGQLCTNTSYNAREPITLSQLSGEYKQFWNAESDEYWEVGLGSTRP